MSLTRRDFLAASSVIAGFHLLGCDEPGVVVVVGDAPCTVAPWVKLALDRMKREERPGLFLRVPSSTSDREALGQALLNAIDLERSEARVIFVEAVVVCVDARTYAQLFRTAPPGEQVALVSPAGIRVDGIARLPSDAVLALGDLLHGPEDARLEERAKALRGTLPSVALTAVERVDVDEIPHHLPAAAPLVAIAFRKGDAQRRERLDIALRRWLQDPEFHDVDLPYGVEGRRPEITSSCGGGGCLFTGACGMACIPDRAREFIRFLSG